MVAMPVSGTLLERGLRGLIGAWRGIAGGGETLPLVREGVLGAKDAERLHGLFAECLEARGGEVSARARAAALGRLYLGLNDDGKRAFLQVLAGNFTADAAALDKAMTAVRDDGGGFGTVIV